MGPRLEEQLSRTKTGLVLGVRSVLLIWRAESLYYRLAFKIVRSLLSVDRLEEPEVEWRRHHIESLRQASAFRCTVRLVVLKLFIGIIKACLILALLYLDHYLYRLANFRVSDLDVVLGTLSLAEPLNAHGTENCLVVIPIGMDVCALA